MRGAVLFDPLNAQFELLAGGQLQPAIGQLGQFGDAEGVAPGRGVGRLTVGRAVLDQRAVSDLDPVGIHIDLGRGARFGIAERAADRGRVNRSDSGERETPDIQAQRISGPHIVRAVEIRQGLADHSRVAEAGAGP